MTTPCQAPLSDEELLDYWIDALPSSDGERVEDHIFACDECARRLEAMSALGAGLADLVRRGHVAGVIPRALLNRIQRDGVHVRLFSLAPGERVPCAAFPGDDLMILALRADFSGAGQVTISLTDAADAVIGESAEVPVRDTDVEILWATPGDIVRRMPTAHLRVTLRSSSPGATVLAEYELDHTSLPAS